MRMRCGNSETPKQGGLEVFHGQGSGNVRKDPAEKQARINQPFKAKLGLLAGERHKARPGTGK